MNTLLDRISIRPMLALVVAAMMCAMTNSCSPVLYTPVGHNVPLFQKKGEVAVTAGVGYTESTAGFSASAAWAVDSSWLVMGSLYAFQSSSTELFIPVPTTGRGNYFEFGGGKFHYNPDTRLGWEILAGMGFGSFTNAIDAEYVNANYVKPFVQPSVGFIARHFEAAITPRIGLVNYTSQSTSLDDPLAQTAVNTYFDQRKSTFVFEPGFTLRAGWKNVKLQVQYSYTTFDYPVLNQNYNSAFNYLRPVDRNFISVTLFILLSDRWRAQ